MSEIIKRIHALQAFQLGHGMYLTGVGTFNDPYFMKPVHAIEVVEENKERIAVQAYQQMYAGALAVVEAVLFDSQERTDSQKEQVLHSEYLRWKKAYYGSIDSDTYGEAVRRISPSAIGDHAMRGALEAGEAVGIPTLMGGSVGVHPFFDGWKPTQRVVPVAQENAMQTLSLVQDSKSERSVQEAS